MKRRGVVAILGTFCAYLCRAQSKAEGTSPSFSFSSDVPLTLTFTAKEITVYGDGRAVKLTIKEVMDALEGK